MNQRVLVFSVDAMVYEDLQHLRSCRNTKKYFQNACGVRHIRSIYPTVTYPAHTTILTGCYPASHGVISNTHFTTGSTEYEWLWDASNVKVPDVITAAKDQGYTTGAVFWPVTGNHKAVDYLIDEYWCPHEGETLLGGFSNMGSGPEMLKIIEKNQHLLPNGGKLGRVALMDHPQIDHFLISCACDIIREYSPEFMLVHNGNIDWNKVKADGIEFAILRAGFGRLEKQKDEKFEQNYAEAKAAGIPVGAYWYSYAMSPEEAELEANVFLKVIKGKQFEMPVYFDLEEKKQFDLGKEKVSAIMRAFLERVESAGYFTGLYGSASPLFTHTADDIKSHYTIWLAHWVDRTNYSGAYAVWQYSEKGKVDGISGNVDLDICYKDFPTIIKGKGLNGWGKAANPTPVPDPEPTADSKTATVTVQIGNETYKGTIVKA